MEYEKLKFKEVIEISKLLMINLKKEESIRIIKDSITYLDEIIKWYDENWNEESNKNNKANTCLIKDYYTSLLNGIICDNNYVIEKYKGLLPNICENWISGINLASNEDNKKQVYVENELNSLIAEIKRDVYNSSVYYKMGQLFEIKNSFNRAYLCYEHASALSQNNDDYNVCINQMLKLRNDYDIKVKNVSIIILSHNDLNYLKVCIQAIRNNNINSIYEIIVLDNNSIDGTIEWLDGQDDVKYLTSNNEEEFYKNYNDLVHAYHEGNDVLFLNSDSIVMNNSILDLRMALYSKEDVGAVGACGNEVLNYQQIKASSNTFNEELVFGEENNIPDEKRYEEKVKLSSFAFMVKDEVVKKVGWLDDRFEPGYFSDDDYSYRVLLAGYKLLLANDSYIYSFSKMLSDNKKFNDLYVKNSKVFKDKWGFSIEYSSNVREDLIELIKEDKNKEINILEVGCACGATLLKLKYLYPNSNLYGIEFDEKPADIANHFAQVDTYDIESTELNYDENFFDYIIFGDVLEHLKDPAKVVTNMKRYLKKSGSLIISLPNIMHYSVIFSLLNGNFTYGDAGILDKTHLKFFTKNEIISMLTNAGYNIETMKMKIVDENEEANKKIDEIMKLSFVTSSEKEEFKTYQYIVKAKMIGNE